MSREIWHRVARVAAALNDSPLYRTSQAGMELFHSNLIGWVLRTHPHAAGPLADLLGFPSAPVYEVRREWRRIDLVVLSGRGGEGVVLENKVTALPDAAQLLRYWEDVQAHAPGIAERAAFVLLSLLPPFEDLPGPWRRLDYRRLDGAMRQVAAALGSGFDADFVREYARLTALLADLVETAGLEGREDEPYFLDEETKGRLRQVGVGDLVLKVRNLDLVQRVIARTGVLEGGWHEAKWSNGQPLASRFTCQADVPGPGRMHLGWQLQGRQLRVVALLEDPELRGSGEERAKAREAAVEAHLRDWFDAERLQELLPGRVVPYAGTKPYNHFAPDFVYRYGTLLPDVTPAEMVPALARLTHQAEVHLADLKGR